ncbi:MFS transporter [Salmonella enterica subsp. enterica]|nr:MFS transporter [Salmonella enterica subsp. enterica]
MSETKKSGIDYWKQIVVVMSLGWVAIWIYRTVLTPIYPEIQASLDNVSNKVKVILGLEIVAAAMLAFTVLSPNTTMLMVSLTLYGLLGKMAVDPILISFVSEQASAKSLGRAFSLFNFFGMSSAVVAPTLTGFISDVTGSKEISFVISACLVVTGTLIFAVVTLYKKKATQRIASA